MVLYLEKQPKKKTYSNKATFHLEPKIWTHRRYYNIVIYNTALYLNELLPRWTLYPKSEMCLGLSEFKVWFVKKGYYPHSR